jgi:hypothetical protein
VLRWANCQFRLVGISSRGLDVSWGSMLWIRRSPFLSSRACNADYESGTPK